MTQNEFLAECLKHDIAPEVALEDDDLRRALAERDDDLVRAILEEDF